MALRRILISRTGPTDATLAPFCLFLHQSLPTTATAHPADLGAGSTALGVLFWCFFGIRAFAGRELKPGATPLALLFGVLLAGLVYWAVLGSDTGSCHGDVRIDAASCPAC
jgi:amino acid transporter